MFGMDVSELMVLLVVGIVVVGPKRLPELMRKAGTYIAKLRRLSTNLRAQSGIDRILREEGLDKEIRELRALKESLSKQAMLDGLVNAVNKPPPARPRPLPPASKPTPALAPAATTEPTKPDEAAADAKADKPVTDGPAAQETVSDAAEATALDAATGETKPASPAAALIKPAEGTVARSDGPQPRPEPVVTNAFRSVREREYPAYGPDHYEALPDDLEEDEEAAAAAEPAPAASEAAS